MEQFTLFNFRFAVTSILFPPDITVSNSFISCQSQGKFSEMGSVYFSVPMVITPSLCSKKIDIGYVNNPHMGMGLVVGLSCNSQLPFPSKCRIQCSRILRIFSLSHGQTAGEGNSEEEEESVDELRVPNHWLDPSKAVEVKIYIISFLSFSAGA